MHNEIPGASPAIETIAGDKRKPEDSRRRNTEPGERPSLTRLFALFRPSFVRLFIALAATLLYVFVFLFLYQQVGPELSLIAVLPVTVVGWLFKRHAGLLAGVLAILLNMLLFNLVGVPLAEIVPLLTGPGSVILVIFGGIVGRSRELLEQVRDNTQALEHEIADRKQAEAALKEAKEEAEAANIAKSEFVSLVSHELRAPITAIRLGEELLSTRVSGFLNDDQRKLLEMISANTDRMLSLVSDLTDVSRLETRQFQFKYEAVSLDRVLAMVVANAAAQIEEQGHNLILQLPPDLLPLWCDRDRLSQILMNLLSNAVKYTPPGGEIRVTAKNLQQSEANGEGNPGVCVTVADNGMGISKEEQNMIFEKFFRGDSARAMTARGTGLGLAITKGLIEMQNGRIWFESTPRQGSEFHFTLPAVNGQYP